MAHAAGYHAEDIRPLTTVLSKDKKIYYGLDTLSTKGSNPVPSSYQLCDLGYICTYMSSFALLHKMGTVIIVR